MIVVVVLVTGTVLFLASREMLTNTLYGFGLAVLAGGLGVACVPASARFLHRRLQFGGEMRNEIGFRVILYAGAVMTWVGAAAITNGVFAHGPAVERSYQVVDRARGVARTGAPDGFYLFLGMEGGNEQVAVDSGVWSRTRVGDRFTVRIYHGGLGFPLIDTAPRATAPR